MFGTNGHLLQRGCVLAVWVCVFGCVGVRVCFWLCGCAGVLWLCGSAGVFLVVWVSGGCLGSM